MTKILDCYIFNLIDKYEIRSLYNSYLFFGNLSIISTESFGWNILLSKGKKDINKYFNYGIIILFLIVIFNYSRQIIKTKILSKLYYYSTYDFIDLLKKIPQKELIDMDVLKIASHFKTLKESFKQWLETRFINVRIISVIITFILAITRIHIMYVIILVLIFNALIFVVYNKVYNKIENESVSLYHTEFKLRDFIADSKQKILNMNFNNKKFDELINKLSLNITEINTLDVSMTLLSKLIVIVITFILVFTIAKNESILTKFIYLIITNNLNNFFDSIMEYYRAKTSLTLPTIYCKRIMDFSNKIKQHNLFYNEESIKEILITKINNKTPYLNNQGHILFKKGIYLLNGPSGCGKSSLMRVFKGILKPEIFDYKYLTDKGWKNHSLNKCTYFTIQSYKPSYGESTYNYITNYDEHPNKELAMKCIKIVKMDHLIKNDTEIDLNTFSGGEQMRLSLCQMMYEILKTNYEIILLDEMDSNLDTNTSIDVFTNIFNELKDKIVIVIFHNDELKNLIHNKINIQNGTIIQ
jgi:ABC-type lipoprotein export system ATPase subunit